MGKVNRKKIKKMKELRSADFFEIDLPKCKCCGEDIPDAVRVTREFCNDAHRKQYWAEQQEILYKLEHATLKNIKENSKILSKILKSGTSLTSLNMLKKIGFRLDSAFVPYVRISGQEIYKFGPVFLTLFGGDDAEISKTYK